MSEDWARARARGERADPTCLPALFAACRDGWHGAHAVALAVDVLVLSGPSIPREHLEAAMDFPGTFVYESEEAVGFGSEQICGLRDVDGARVRQLAREELERRDF